MSLLNEALKRAQTAETRRALIPAASPSLQPATERAPTRKKAACLVGVATVLLMLTGMIAIWPRNSIGVVKAAGSRPLPREHTVSKPDTTIRPPVQASLPPAQGRGSSNTVPEPGTTKLAEPLLQLQAIHYRLHRPSAIINGKTLWVGDQIDDARVVAIERHSVRLAIQGRVKTLHLPTRS